MEMELSNYISYFIKKQIGKGPEDVKIKITDNIIVFFIYGLLSPMEKNILKSEEGKRIILESRRLYLENVNQERFSTYEKIVGAKLIDNYEGWKIENDSAVGVLVFDKRIEK